MNDKFWLRDISVLLDSEKIFQILPLSSMTIEEKLNSIVRFGLIMSILLMILRDNYLYIYFFISSLLLTYIVYTFGKKEKYSDKNVEKEIETEMDNEDLDMPISNIEDINDREVSRKNCKKPTKNNPFMNVLLSDDYTKTKPACYYDKKTKEEIDKYFYSDLFEDISNLYGRRNMQRSFYSLPSTTVPNDQIGFANWCYKLPKTCKEGNGLQCYNNLYNRLPNMTEPGSHAGARI